MSAAEAYKSGEVEAVIKQRSWAVNGSKCTAEGCSVHKPLRSCLVLRYVDLMVTQPKLSYVSVSNPYWEVTPTCKNWKATFTSLKFSLLEFYETISKYSSYFLHQGFFERNLQKIIEMTQRKCYCPAQMA